MVAGARELRGQHIADACPIRYENGRWPVPSQSGGGRYTAANDPATGGRQCSCPDYEIRGMKCKHIFAVGFTSTKTERNRDGSAAVTTAAAKAERKTYPQDWPNYNAAQVNERRLFHVPLSDLCAAVPEPVRPQPKGGRPFLPAQDAPFAACPKVYSLTSARRFAGELEEAHEAGFVRHLPHFDGVLDVFDRDETTPLLKGTVETSALPLKAAETNFAVDSTGFATVKYQSWFDQEYGVVRKEARWVKAHFATGVKTSAVTAVNIDHQSAADGPPSLARPPGGPRSGKSRRTKPTCRPATSTR